MPRVMEKVVPVKLTTDEINCYATIQRSMISAITACLRLKDKKGKHTKAQIEKLRELKKWAENQYDMCVIGELDESGNPAEG